MITVTCNFATHTHTHTLSLYLPHPKTCLSLAAAALLSLVATWTYHELSQAVTEDLKTSSTATNHSIVHPPFHPAPFPPPLLPLPPSPSLSLSLSLSLFLARSLALPLSLALSLRHPLSLTGPTHKLSGLPRLKSWSSSLYFSLHLYNYHSDIIIPNYRFWRWTNLIKPFEIASHELRIPRKKMILYSSTIRVSKL